MFYCFFHHFLVQNRVTEKISLGPLVNKTGDIWYVFLQGKFEGKQKLNTTRSLNMFCYKFDQRFLLKMDATLIIPGFCWIFTLRLNLFALVRLIDWFLSIMLLKVSFLASVHSWKLRQLIFDAFTTHFKIMHYDSWLVCSGLLTIRYLCMLWTLHYIQIYYCLCTFFSLKLFKVLLSFSLLLFVYCLNLIFSLRISWLMLWTSQQQAEFHSL